MKNLMIYISPTGSFDNPRSDLASNDAGPLAKIQIENSLALGWKKEDILLVTNFTFQYGDSRALVLPEVPFFERKPQVSKVNAITTLFEKDLIEKRQLYWFHDLDAFQVSPFSEKDFDLAEDEIGVTDFGGAKKFAGEERYSGGVFFFKSESYDIFNEVKKLCYDKKIDEEEALGLLTIQDKDIRRRVKKVNSTYNFIGYNIESVYENSIKPIKVVHFHPLIAKKRHGNINSLLFFKGENPLHIPFIPKNLLKLFAYHNIQ